jgi:hypothetical protein
VMLDLSALVGRYVASADVRDEEVVAVSRFLVWVNGEGEGEWRRKAGRGSVVVGSGAADGEASDVWG